jgi:hypothetical protein
VVSHAPLTQLLVLSCGCGLLQVQEQQEEVWAAALGCLLQLTTHAGHWVASEVVHLPLQAVQGLLAAAQRYSWSPELYCRLLQLASWLLYQDAAAAEPGSKQEESHTSAAAAAVAGQGVAPPADTSTDSGGKGDAAGSSTDAAPNSSSSSSRAPGATNQPQQQQQQQEQQAAEVLPGGLLASQLAALGGPAVLVHHLAHAPSPGAQLCCLVPLVHALVPPGGCGQATALSHGRCRWGQ